MDLSSKKTGDVFRLKLYGIEYDVKVVGDNEEMFKYFEARRTKVFYSQIRAMCRFYGKKNVRKYKKL